MWFLRKIAWPVSLVYGVVVNVRNILFDRGIFNSVSFSTPTICVGNLSVGGTGKTPMIEYLIANFQENHKLAVLSRGYLRNSSGFHLATISSSVQELGDEPFQIHRKFPEVSVAVDANRRNGISILERTIKPDVILLDDAFQHRKVVPTFSILLTTFAKPYFKDWYLPTGDLRDAKYASKRADIIVVTKCPQHLTTKEKNDLVKGLNPEKDQQVLFSTLSYDANLYGDNRTMKIEELENQCFTLVTGIANAAPLVSYLKTAKQLSFDHKEFSDHHNFKDAEIEQLNSCGLIITTEKDYVRLAGKVDSLFYIKIAHDFLEDGEQRLFDLLHTILTPYR